MADTSTPVVITTDAASSGVRAIHGVRERVFGSVEEKAMISKTTYDSIEGLADERNTFYQIASAAFVAGLALGLEKIFDYLETKSGSDLGILIVCAGAIGMGVLFGYLGRKKQSKIRNLREHLFSKDSMISDTTFISFEDGSTHATNNFRVTP